MAVLGVLFAGIVLARLSGWAGADFLNSWKDAARAGLSLMLMMTGISHFTKMRADMVKMVPSSIPAPETMVFFTGVCELLAAVGIWLPLTRVFAGLCLMLLLIALFPANLRASRLRISIRERPPTPLPLRTAMQFLFLALAYWTTQTG